MSLQEVQDCVLDWMHFMEKLGVGCASEEGNFVARRLVHRLSQPRESTRWVCRVVNKALEGLLLAREGDWQVANALLALLAHQQRAKAHAKYRLMLSKMVSRAREQQRAEEQQQQQAELPDAAPGLDAQTRASSEDPEYMSDTTTPVVDCVALGNNTGTSQLGQRSAFLDSAAATSEMGTDALLDALADPPAPAPVTVPDSQGAQADGSPLQTGLVSPSKFFAGTIAVDAEVVSMADLVPARFLSGQTLGI